MLQSLQKRFARMEEIKCLVLDPRYKGHVFFCSGHTDQGKTMDKRRACHCVWATENSHHWRPRISSETEKGGRWRITWSLQCSWTNVCKHLGASMPHDEHHVFEQLDQYLREPLIERQTGQPLEWWNRIHPAYTFLHHWQGNSSVHPLLCSQREFLLRLAIFKTTRAASQDNTQNSYVSCMTTCRS